MTPFEAHRDKLNAGVRNHLGDSVSLRLADGTTLDTVAFLSQDGGAFGSDNVDPLRRVWHMEIDKVLIPGGPASIARVLSPLLPGPMKPSTDTVDSSGDVWTFDLQKAAP